MSNNAIVFDRSTMQVRTGFQGRAIAPSVSVGNTGRIVLNKLSSEPFAGCKWISFVWEGDERKLIIKGLSSIPAGKKETSFWPCQIGKDNKSVTVASAGPLQEIGYDYKRAGHQVFPATVDAKTKSVSFVVPETTPEPKPRRARKAKAVTTAVPQNSVENNAQAAS